MTGKQRLPEVGGKPDAATEALRHKMMGGDEHFVFQATRERVTKFAALVRAAALEEAAGVCEVNADRWPGTSKVYAAMECAAAIRQLKDKT